MALPVRTSAIVTHAAAVAIGIVIARVAQNIPVVEFDYKLDPIAITALLATIVISVAFFRRFEKVKYSDQLRKNAVIGRLGQSMANIQRLEEICSAQDIPHSEVVKQTKKCRRDFEAYAKFAAALSAEVPAAELSKYQLLCAELKDLLTNSPLRSDLNPQLRISNGMIRLHPSRLVEVETKISESKELLYELEERVILDIS